jgi:hypothetical protein
MIQQVANVEMTGPRSFRMTVKMKFMERNDQPLDPTRIWIPVHQTQYLFTYDDWWIGIILNDWTKYTGQQIWDGVTPLKYEVVWYGCDDFETTICPGLFINPDKHVRNLKVKSMM